MTISPRASLLVGLRTALSLTLAALAAAGDSDPARAWALPAGSPEISALAAPWHERQGELMEMLSDTDQHRRRGAARLCAVAGIPADTLAEALARCTDHEARRIGAAGLIGKTLTAKRLLMLQDAALICDLLQADPDPKALAAPETHEWLCARLLDPTTAAEAAAVVAARGALADWSEPLLGAVQRAEPPVVEAAHHALELLTRTQRSLDAYAGDRSLLAKDWRDEVGKRSIAAAASGQDQALIAGFVADLPDDKALEALLGIGPSAIPELEQAMAAADRPRRAQLAPVARLLARAIDPKLYRKLGAAGFDGMDAGDERTRLATLRAIAEAVLALKDERGIEHLVTWADDAAPVVRAAAWDRLTRMSDSRREFSAQWNIDEQHSLFPVAPTVTRLRRSIRQGSPDEQIAALHFAATVSAKVLADDVAALLLSPSDMVIDAAIETLGHLDAISTVIPALVQLAKDTRQPAQRRAKALELVSGGDGILNASVYAAIDALMNDSDALVARAAARTMVKVAKKPERKNAVMAKLKGRGDKQLMVDLAKDDDALSGVLWSLIEDADPAVATAAIKGLMPGRHGGKAKKPDADQRAAIGRLIEPGARALPDALPFAVMVGALPFDDGLARLEQLQGAESGPLLAALIHVVPMHAEAVHRIVQVVLDRAAAGAAPGPDAYKALLAVIMRFASLEHRRLEALANADLLEVLDSVDQDSTFGNDVSTTTYTLADGTKIVFESSYTERRTKYKLKTGPVDSPSEADVAGLAPLLASLQPSIPATVAAATPHQIALLTAYLADADPPEGTEDTWVDDGVLWRALAALRPGLRPRFVTAVAVAPHLNVYEFIRFTETANPDLLGTALGFLKPGTERSQVQQIMTYVGSLEPAAVLPRLDAILAFPMAVSMRETTTLLRKLGPLPMPAALKLVADDRLAPYAVAGYGAEQAAAVESALSALTQEQVLACSKSVRRLRTASPAVVDAVLATLVAKGGAIEAAWLRSGLPLEAGMEQPYRDALQAEDPMLWMVGAASALKDDRLSAHDFMARVHALPPAAVSDAGLVAQRYLVGKLDAETSVLSTILRDGTRACLTNWLPACPPDDEIAKALASRVADPAICQTVGMLLSQRLVKDREHWTPIIRAIAASAGGRLDYLLPAP